MRTSMRGRICGDFVEPYQEFKIVCGSFVRLQDPRLIVMD